MTIVDWILAIYIISSAWGLGVYCGLTAPDEEELWPRRRESQHPDDED